MSSPMAISPLIKTARWTLLPLGMFYGYRKNEKLKVRRAKEREIENAEAKQYLEDKAHRKQMEYEKFVDENPMFFK